MAFEKGRTSQTEESWGLSASLALSWLVREQSPARTTTSGPQTSPSAYVSMKIVWGSICRGQTAASAVMLTTAWPVTMVTAQRLLLWPEADDDWWWIFKKKFPLSPFSEFLFSPASFCPSVRVPGFHLLQSPACPTSRPPRGQSSHQITQKDMGTTWTVSGSSNQIQAPESTWHLMTLTLRRRTIL